MMFIDGENTEHGLLQAQAQVWNCTFNFINSMSLKCAVQLGIPDIIHSQGQPMTLSDLVAALPIRSSTKADHHHHVYRLMRLLVHSGFFTVEEVGEEEGYLLTKASFLLLKDNPVSLRPFLLAMLDPVVTEPWHCMSTWFQNDDPNPFFVAHGRTLWEYAGQEPRLNKFFNEAMGADSLLVSRLMSTECEEVFRGLESLVDVGGGTGTMARAIAETFPHMKCSVLDLPHVVVGLHECKNLNFVEGDMFEAVPPADATMLKWILHDWSDEECVKILKNCREAIIATSSKKKGVNKAIIIDMVMDNNKKRNDDHSDVETQLFWDMLMMVEVFGKERNEKEWAKLFYDAGFSSYRINPVLGLRALIEVFP